jgi:hypothetical protein
MAASTKCLGSRPSSKIAQGRMQETPGSSMREAGVLVDAWVGRKVAVADLPSLVWLRR